MQGSEGNDCTCLPAARYPLVEGTYGEASPDSPLSTQRWPRSRVSGLTLVVAKLTRQAEVEME